MARNILNPFQLLELNVISAQDLSPVSRAMRTYAVAWIHPDRKLSTRVDTHGHKNPTWNDKFVFRVDDDFLYGDTSAIMIDIYALHWFKDIHVGSVRVLITNLIPFPSSNNPSSGMRFGALHVRRPSGRPQGILNIGVAVLDSSMRSMPLYTHDSSAVGYRHLMGEKDAYEHHNHMSPRQVPKPELRRTRSDTSSMISARQQRHRGARAKPTSVLSSSDAASKKSGKKKSRSSRSRASSRVSGSDVSQGEIRKPTSVLSEPGDGFQWRTKLERPDSMLSGSDLSEKPIGVKSPSPSRSAKDSEVIDHKNQKLQTPESLAIGSETTDDTHDSADKFNANENQRLFQKANNVYEVNSSPKPQFRNSPAPKLLQAPAVGFGGSRKNTPMHPAVGYGGSNRNTPMHPTVDYGGSHRNTPMHPTVAYGGSHRNTPLHQVVGYGGSRKPTPKGTPVHSIGKYNPALEYATPRRTNWGGIAPPPVITESELGPSPSEVAAALAKNPKIDEGEESTVGGWSQLDESVEGLQSKLERWRTELPPVYDRGEPSSYPASTRSKKSIHNRRHTDGGNGLFSCFSNICGCECSIVCGGDNSRKKKAAGRQRSPSADDASFL